ncbi:MAG: hypothetical protein JO186_06675 [Actinobacteria bacterium]|nr:hypothetical protein [Actinomycetota bacterium]MBV8397051.1 hypothetical protein [Actinomycetota bacterium]MBV8598043.1 hypothetical protein [Actinomycetota bacterium]
MTVKAIAATAAVVLLAAGCGSSGNSRQSLLTKRIRTDITKQRHMHDVGVSCKSTKRGYACTASGKDHAGTKIDLVVTVDCPPGASAQQCTYQVHR